MISLTNKKTSKFWINHDINIGLSNE
jgi:hypothetical protein